MRLDLRSTRTQQADAAIEAGMATVFADNRFLNTTYALDPVTLNEISNVAYGSANGLGLPFGAAYFSYPDKYGNPKMFGPEEIEALFQAMRDFVALIQYYGTGQISMLPSQPVVITGTGP